MLKIIKLLQTGTGNLFGLDVIWVFILIITYQIKLVLYVYSLTHSAILLSHEKYHGENWNLVKETLIENGYPLVLLNQKIANRYEFLMSNKYRNKNTNETITTKVLKKIITLSYINNFHKAFYRI